MIRINLLPEEFRIQEKSTTQIPAMKIAVGLGVFFAVLTAWFYVDFLLSQGKITKVKAQWAILQPQSAQLKQLETEVETVLKPENQFLNRYVTAARPLTHVLSWLSESLPDKAWLIEVKLEREGEGARLFVKGLALPTKEKSSIEQIESYLHDLKKNIPESNLNLTTTRMTIDQVELTQFIAHFDWGLTPPAAVPVPGQPPAPAVRP